MRSKQPVRSRSDTWRRRRSRSSVPMACALVLATVFIAGYDVGLHTSGNEPSTTAWPPAVVNIVIFGGGLAGSWILTGWTTRRHTKSAFRRLRSVRVGLEKIRQLAQSDSPDGHAVALGRIGEIASVHNQSVQDALADWADLAPQDIAEVQVDRPYEEDGFLPTGPGAIAPTGEKT